MRLALILLSIAICVSGATAANGPNGGAVVGISTGEFAFDGSPDPPGESAAWESISLPDYWNVARPGKFGAAWYRLRCELPAQPKRSMAVYLPMISRGEIYVNGVLIGEHLRAPSSAHYPRLVDVAPTLLHAGSNYIFVRARVRDGASFRLSTVEVGDFTTLQEEYFHRLWMQNLGVQAYCLIVIALGIATLVIWSQRPKESAYGFFAAHQLMTAVYLCHFFLRNPPFGDPLWVSLHDSTLAGNILMIFFALRYANWRFRKIEVLLWIVFVLTVVLAFADDFGYLPEGTGTSWENFIEAGELVYVSVFAIHAYRQPSISNWLLAIVSPSVLLSDIAFRITIDRSAEVAALFGGYQFLPMCLVVSWVLLSRFISSLNESEKLNADLEQRVRQKQAELEANFQRLQHLERERAVAEERQRIMSDMHDGIGAQLITTLGLAERGQLSKEEMAAALRECLDDLRLTIDSLEPADNDLLPVLGNFRYRVDPRLQRQGITLDWRVSDLPRLACLTPRNLLHLLRILQEAFTNVLKHARASLIRVETGLLPDGRQVFIRVSDNGAGFSGEHRGRGLANMQQRAERIGGRLHVTPSASGTTLELLLPVGPGLPS